MAALRISAPARAHDMYKGMAKHSTSNEVYHTVIHLSPITAKLIGSLDAASVFCICNLSLHV